MIYIFKSGYLPYSASSRTNQVRECVIYNMLRNKTAIDCWNILKYEIESIINTFVPLQKTRKTVQKETLIKRSYKKKIVFKQTMLRVYRHTRNDEDYVN